jgi:hypothetical protein
MSRVGMGKKDDRDQAHRILSTVLRHTRKLLGEARENAELDEDWIDDVVGGILDLFRDLAVALGLSYRAADWEGADEPDPIEVIERAKPFAELKRLEALRKLEEVGHCFNAVDDGKGFCLVTSPEDALERVQKLLRVLPKLGDAEDAEELCGEIDSLTESDR